MRIVDADHGLLLAERERRSTKVQELEIPVYRVDFIAKHIGGGRRSREYLERRDRANRHEQERRPVARQRRGRLERLALRIEELHEAASVNVTEQRWPVTLSPRACAS